MAWRHPRASVRVAIYDVDGDEAAFCAFMDRLSRGLAISEVQTIRPALERYFDRNFTVSVDRRAAANGDDIWDFRPTSARKAGVSE